MSFHKNILVVDDNDKLREQLIKLIIEVVPDWKIINANSYEAAIAIIDSSSICILVSDLYLEPNEELIYNTVPSGIRVAQYLRNKQPDCFIYIVSSNIGILISQKQLSDYLEFGVNDFLDRNVDSYEKFSQKFQYQLKKVDQSIIEINSFPFIFWKPQDISTYESFWVLILDVNVRKYKDLIADCVIWQKNVSEPGAAFSFLHIHNDSKTSYLEKAGILNNFTNPTLIFSDTHRLDDVIKISPKTLKQIIRKDKESQDRIYLKLFLNLIHRKIRIGTTIFKLKEEMQDSKFWDFLDLDKIKGFCLDSGNLKLSSDKDTKTTIQYVNIEKGNYNETIHGNYDETNKKKYNEN